MSERARQIREGGTGVIEQEGTGEIREDGTGMARWIAAATLLCGMVFNAAASTYQAVTPGMLITVDSHEQVVVSIHSSNGSYVGSGKLSKGFAEIHLVQHNHGAKADQTGTGENSDDGKAMPAQHSIAILVDEGLVEGELVLSGAKSTIFRAPLELVGDTITTKADQTGTGE